MGINWKLVILISLGVVLLAASAYALWEWHQYRHTSEGLATGLKAYEIRAIRVPLKDNIWKVLALVMAWSVAAVLEIRRIRRTGHSLPLGETMLRVFRRWKIMLRTAVVVCAVGVPAAWLLTPPEFRTKATIRVSLVPPSDSESARNIPDLDSLLNTAAARMSSRTIVDSVVKKLTKENLSLFADFPELSNIKVLRAAITDGTIEFISQPSKEFFTVEITSPNSDEAEDIVNVFIDAYMHAVSAAQEEASSDKLKILLEKRHRLSSEMEKHHQLIRPLSLTLELGRLERRNIFGFWGPFGFTDPHDVADSYIRSAHPLSARLWNDLVDAMIDKISLDVRIETIQKGIENTVPHADKMWLQNAVINSDVEVKSFLSAISNHESEILLERQKQLQENPELEDLIEALDFLKKKLECRKEKLTEEFNAKYCVQLEKRELLTLAEAEMELSKVIKRGRKLKYEVKLKNETPVRLLSAAFKVYDAKERLEETTNLCSQVSRSIAKIESEKLRHARITIEQRASSVTLIGHKLKRSIRIVSVGLVLGIVFAAVLEIKRSKAKASDSSLPPGEEL